MSSMLGQIVRLLGFFDLGSEHCKATKINVGELLTVSTGRNRGPCGAIYEPHTDLV